MENEEIERKRSRVTLIVYIVCILILLGFATFANTQAKYAKADTESIVATAKDFDVWFAWTTVDGANTSVPILNNNGVYRLNNINDYDNLKLDLKYKGEGKSYVRFKITESWQHQEAGHDVITPHSLSTYTLGSDFYDNRSDDGFIYCRVPLYGNDANTVISKEAIIQCIKGNDANDLLDPSHASTFVDISIELEAVQWNRAMELWGLRELPWEN